MSYKTVLALDSAMNGCGAALYSGGGVVSRTAVMARGQAECLIPMVQDCMAEAGVSYDSLGAVAVTVGPGAFTGLRIGLSAAKAFGLSLDLPVYGITTLQALALAYVRSGAGGACTVLIETKRTDFYMQRFDEVGQALCEPVALLAAEIAPLVGEGDVLIGDAARRFCTETGRDLPVAKGYDLPDIGLIAALAGDDEARAAFMSRDLAPVYLRPPDVSLSQKIQRVLA